MSDLTLQIDDRNRSQFGPCECCGNLSERVWGYVYRSDAAVAVYFVEWTPGHIEKSASFDLIIGKWGEQARPNDRRAAAVEFRRLESGPSFRVIDAGTRKIATSSLVSGALRRDEVIGTPLAQEIFAITDAIYLEDPRINELRDEPLSNSAATP
jgi:hypothetical protein